MSSCSFQIVHCVVAQCQLPALFSDGHKKAPIVQTQYASILKADKHNKVKVGGRQTSKTRSVQATLFTY